MNKMLKEWVISFLSFGVGLVLQLMGWFIYHTPFVIKKSFARLVSKIWFYVVPFRKRIMLINVAMVFPRRDQESNRAFQARSENIVSQNMVHMVLLLLELLERFYWTPQTVSQKVHFYKTEEMEKFIKAKQGFFVLSSHLGNWEIMTRAGCAIGMPLTIITRFLRNPVFDRIWVQSRKKFGLELLSESGSGLAVVRSVQRGRVLGFIADQHTGEPHGIEANFLGHKAWCPKALALMSDRLKAPVVPAFMVRDPRTGEHHLFFSEELEFPELNKQGTSLRTESGTLTLEGIRYHVEQCNRVQEKWIRRYPEQFLWMHKRFKNLIDYQKESLPWEL